MIATETARPLWLREDKRMLDFFAEPAAEAPASIAELRAQVRGFLSEARDKGWYVRGPEAWDRYDEEFTKRVAARGWIGMTWPREYGGGGFSSLERYIVSEELLMAGAPVRAHWLADRQIGPLLLAHGSQEQKDFFLPRIVRGECFFCLGLSEPDSGSDLASIRTRATKVDGGWRINGTKVWTSYAHKAHYMNLFARTASRDEADRHGGVTQFIVDLKAPGVTVSPIINLANEHDFNQVVFDDYFVPDARVIGIVGNGWKQVSGELAHERSGAERWAANYGVLVKLHDLIGSSPDRCDAEKVGRLVSQLWTLHRMSYSLAVLIGKGATPDHEAALVKDLGGDFDQHVTWIARQVGNEDLRGTERGKAFAQMLEHAVFYSPSVTIRGGTREILRGIIARGLGLR